MTTLENNLIKKPYIKINYTKQQMVELAMCSDPGTGPEYFLSNFFHIQHPTQGSIKYTPFDYQKRLLNTYHNYLYSISMLPRQTGKSTTAAGYLLWYAMFVPDSTILIAAHKYLGSQEIMQRIRYAYEACPDHIRAGVTDYNKGSIKFDNGSRIVSSTTTENTGRGMSISLLYLDEFAFVRASIAREFWTAISPTLSTGGKCIITSTPNTDEDQFAELWKNANKCVDEYGNETEVGVNGFKAFRAYWNEHPDRDETWAETMRAKLGIDRFKREMDCDFVTFEETLINAVYLSQMQYQEPIEKMGQIRWYKKPTKNNFYIGSLDPSLGTGGDNAAIQVLELPTLEQVAEWQHNKTRIQDQIKILRDITHHIFDITKQEENIYYSVENNTLGEAALVAISELGEESFKGTFLTEPGKAAGKLRKGFTTTRRSKLSACAKFKHLLESGKMKIYSRNLIRELKNFVALGGAYEAKVGETDDLVLSMLLAIRMAQTVQNFDQTVDDVMRGNDEHFEMPMPILII